MSIMDLSSLVGAGAARRHDSGSDGAEDMKARVARLAGEVAQESSSSEDEAEAPASNESKKPEEGKESADEVDGPLSEAELMRMTPAERKEYFHFQRERRMNRTKLGRLDSAVLAAASFGADDEDGPPVPVASDHVAAEADVHTKLQSAVMSYARDVEEMRSTDAYNKYIKGHGGEERLPRSDFELERQVEEDMNRRAAAFRQRLLDRQAAVRAANSIQTRTPTGYASHVSKSSGSRSYVGTSGSAFPLGKGQRSGGLPAGLTSPVRTGPQMSPTPATSSAASDMRRSPKSVPLRPESDTPVGSAVNHARHRSMRSPRSAASSRLSGGRKRTATGGHERQRSRKSEGIASTGSKRRLPHGLTPELVSMDATLQSRFSVDGSSQPSPTGRPHSAIPGLRNSGRRSSSRGGPVMLREDGHERRETRLHGPPRIRRRPASAGPIPDSRAPEVRLLEEVHKLGDEIELKPRPAGREIVENVIKTLDDDVEKARASPPSSPAEQPARIDISPSRPTAVQQRARAVYDNGMQFGTEDQVLPAKVRLLSGIVIDVAAHEAEEVANATGGTVTFMPKQTRRLSVVSSVSSGGTPPRESVSRRASDDEDSAEHSEGPRTRRTESEVSSGTGIGASSTLQTGEDEPQRDGPAQSKPATDSESAAASTLKPIDTATGDPKPAVDVPGSGYSSTLDFIYTDQDPASTAQASDGARPQLNLEDSGMEVVRAAAYDHLQPETAGNLMAPHPTPELEPLPAPMTDTMTAVMVESLRAANDRLLKQCGIVDSRVAQLKSRVMVVEKERSEWRALFRREAQFRYDTLDLMTQVDSLKADMSVLSAENKKLVKRAKEAVVNEGKALRQLKRWRGMYREEMLSGVGELRSAHSGALDELAKYRKMYAEESKELEALKIVHSKCRPPIVRKAFKMPAASEDDEESETESSAEEAPPSSVEETPRKVQETETPRDPTPREASPRSQRTEEVPRAPVEVVEQQTSTPEAPSVEVDRADADVGARLPEAKPVHIADEVVANEADRNSPQPAVSSEVDATQADVADVVEKRDAPPTPKAETEVVVDVAPEKAEVPTKAVPVKPDSRGDIKQVERVSSRRRIRKTAHHVEAKEAEPAKPAGEQPVEEAKVADEPDEAGFRKIRTAKRKGFDSHGSALGIHGPYGSRLFEPAGHEVVELAEPDVNVTSFRAKYSAQHMKSLIEREGGWYDAEHPEGLAPKSKEPVNKRRLIEKRMEEEKKMPKFSAVAQSPFRAGFETKEKEQENKTIARLYSRTKSLKQIPILKDGRFDTQKARTLLEKKLEEEHIEKQRQRQRLAKQKERKSHKSNPADDKSNGGSGSEDGDDEDDGLEDITDVALLDVRAPDPLALGDTAPESRPATAPSRTTSTDAKLDVDGAMELRERLPAPAFRDTDSDGERLLAKAREKRLERRRRRKEALERGEEPSSDESDTMSVVRQRAEAAKARWKGPMAKSKKKPTVPDRVPNLSSGQRKADVLSLLAPLVESAPPGTVLAYPDKYHVVLPWKEFKELSPAQAALSPNEQAVQPFTRQKLQWLCAAVYMFKITQDEALDKARRPRSTLSMALYNFVRTKFGIPKLVNGVMYNVLHGIRKYSKQSERIRMFGELLGLVKVKTYTPRKADIVLYLLKQLLPSHTIEQVLTHYDEGHCWVATEDAVECVSRAFVPHDSSNPGPWIEKMPMSSDVRAELLNHIKTQAVPAEDIEEELESKSSTKWELDRLLRDCLRVVLQQEGIFKVELESLYVECERDARDQKRQAREAREAGMPKRLRKAAIEKRKKARKAAEAKAAPGEEVKEELYDPDLKVPGLNFTDFQSFINYLRPPGCAELTPMFAAALFRRYAKGGPRDMQQLRAAVYVREQEQLARTIGRKASTVIAREEKEWKDACKRAIAAAEAADEKAAYERVISGGEEVSAESRAAGGAGGPHVKLPPKPAQPPEHMIYRIKAIKQDKWPEAFVDLKAIIDVSRTYGLLPKTGHQQIEGEDDGNHEEQKDE